MRRHKLSRASKLTSRGSGPSEQNHPDRRVLNEPSNCVLSQPVVIADAPPDLPVPVGPRLRKPWGRPRRLGHEHIVSEPGCPVRALASPRTVRGRHPVAEPWRSWHRVDVFIALFAVGGMLGALAMFRFQRLAPNARTRLLTALVDGAVMLTLIAAWTLLRGHVTALLVPTIMIVGSSSTLAQTDLIYRHPPAS